MTYACSYEVPGNPQMYERVKAEIGLDEPPGMLSHLVVSADRGLRHITVWETKAQWERFRDQHVRPAVGRVLQAAGMTEPPPAPAEQELMVIDIMTAGQALPSPR